MQISKDFCFLYDYNIEDHEEEIDIKFEIPKIFNPSVLNISLDTAKNTILIKIPDQVPIVAGVFLHPVESFLKTKDDKSLTISFEKKTPEKWPYMISKPMPGSGEIDPKSALILFNVLGTKEDKETHEFAQKMLTYSLDSHFLPAILFGVQANLQPGGDKEAAITLLNIAALKYEFPPALFQLGMLLLGDEKSAVNGFNMLQKAAEKGIGLAVVVMASALSPLSDIKFPVKDPEQALILFEQVIKEADEPNALYEAAKLYDAGIGCKPDHEKAMEYLNRAKKANPETPDLPKQAVKPEIKNTIKTISIVATSCVAIAGIGYAVYKIFKNKKK